MASKELYNDLKRMVALESIVVNDDTEGTGVEIDTAGYESVLFIVNVGESGDTLSGSVKLELELHAGDTSGSLSAVTSANDVTGATPAAGGVWATIDADGEDGALYAVSYVGPSRYVQLYVETTGTHTNGTPIGAVAILGHGRNLPVS